MQPNSSDNRIHCYNVEILNLFDPQLRLINIKPLIKNNFIKVQTILVLKHKKRNDDKIFHSCTNLITSDVIRH